MSDFSIIIIIIIDYLQDLLEDMIEKTPEYHDSDQFAVVLQPFFKNTGLPSNVRTYYPAHTNLLVVLQCTFKLDGTIANLYPTFNCSKSRT